jgi:serine/threonine protein kinase
MDTRRYAIAPQQMAGGYGSVIEIHDRYLDRSVLFKRMHDPANNSQLVAEVAALTGIRSRHIIDIYDVDIDQRGMLTGIIIENLRGRDYLHFHAEAAQNPAELTKVIYQLACAVSDLHAANIIHRDLKLDNFKASDAGIVKLYDFGISSSSGTHLTTQNRGTLDYAAPELFTAGGVVTRASDIYSLGICCWKLATNHFPTQLTERPPQGSGPPPSLSTFAPFVDIELVDIIHACIHPDAAARPSAKQVKERCEALLLKGRHKGMFFSDRSAVYELSAQQPTVRIQTGTLGDLRAAYDGTEFKVTGVTGDVYINNVAAVAGRPLHDACVVTFGSFDIGRDRHHISFLCSKPEIVL